MRDLSWLAAPGYALMIDHADGPHEADEASFDILLSLLEEAAAEWATRDIPLWAFLALPEVDFEDAAD